MIVRKCQILWLLILLVGPLANAENVIEDGGVGLSRAEVEFIVKNWTDDMRSSAANDLGDRLELLNNALTSKKLAIEANAISPELDPEAYWRLAFATRNLQSEYAMNYFAASLDIPDMDKLAEERYHAIKDKIALVPEHRYASHILLMCTAGLCNREERRLEIDSILAKLNNGENFEELAGIYSEDPGSKDKGGQFDRWFYLGEKNVSPHFAGGAFELDNVGDYSGAVDTKFGLHIIRLDGIREQYYLTFAELKDRIVALLRQEFVELATKEYSAGFRLSEEASIDGPAMEEIFDKYKD